MKTRIINKKVADIFVWCAVIVAVLGGLATLMLIVFRQSASLAQYGFTLWNLLDVALFWGLAFGVYKRSRTCAIILLIYNLMNRVDMWQRTHNIGVTIGGLALISLSLYFLGVLGTFAYHSIKSENNAEIKSSN